jgi:signal transduction histidine kinase
MEHADVSPQRLARFSSLRWRLPLVILALLLSIGSTYAAMAYRSMEAALRAGGRARVLDAGAELASIFSQAAAARLTEGRQVADAPAIRAFVANGEAPDAVIELLKKLAGRGNAEIALRVRAAGPPIRIESGNVRIERAPDAIQPDAIVARDTVSQLHVSEGRVFFGTSTRIEAPSPAGGAVGILTTERRLTESAGITLIQRLVGHDAHIRLGNANGDVWTDLSLRTEAPPPSSPGDVVSYLDELRQNRLGAALPVKGTPWAVWIDFSEATLLAPARALLWKMLLPTLLVTIVGALAVAVASKRITDPLEEVANAADAIAASRDAPPLRLDRKDEIGRLANAFNEMAARVRQSRESLEARVQERTLELERAREDLQRHAAHLTAVNRELEAFSYSVSHDLRAPLRSIDGFSQAILEDCGGQLDADGHEHLRRIRRAAQRMGQLIDDLLNLSRVSRAEMERREVDLSAMAAKVVEGFAEDGSRTVEYRVQPGVRSMGDPRLLQVALTNLLENAWKFTRDRPHSVIEFGAQQNGHGPVYFVRDNGAGFDMAYSNKLFGAFQRLHHSADFPGTGIGLATVQRIVTRHGGRIWAEGQPDQYAVFYFTLDPEAA